MNIGRVGARALASAEQHPAYAVISQFIRFGLVGVFVTMVNFVVYWAGIKLFALDPNLTWTIGFIVAFIVGYHLQSKWSFAGHGAERKALVHGSRYLIVALVGFAVNSLWVWLCVQYMAFPTWSPLPLVLFVTPLLVFMLNRVWVFR